METPADKPIARWLRASRTSQKMDDGAGGKRDWTYAHLLEHMQAEIGWAPAHPNYSGYERGKATPNAQTLAKFVRFWKPYGIEPPDLTPPVAQPSPPDLAAAVMALTEELAAMRLEREAWRRGVVAVLRSYEDGQVPTGLLDALAPRLPEDARP